MTEDNMTVDYIIAGEIANRTGYIISRSDYILLQRTKEKIRDKQRLFDKLNAGEDV